MPLTFSSPAAHPTAPTPLTPFKAPAAVPEVPQPRDMRFSRVSTFIPTEGHGASHVVVTYEGMKPPDAYTQDKILRAGMPHFIVIPKSRSGANLLLSLDELNLMLRKALLHAVAGTPAAELEPAMRVIYGENAIGDIISFKDRVRCIGPAFIGAGGESQKKIDAPFYPMRGSRRNMRTVDVMTSGSQMTADIFEGYGLNNQLWLIAGQFKLKNVAGHCIQVTPYCSAVFGNPIDDTSTHMKEFHEGNLRTDPAPAAGAGPPDFDPWCLIFHYGYVQTTGFIPTRRGAPIDIEMITNIKEKPEDMHTFRRRNMKHGVAHAVEIYPHRRSTWTLHALTHMESVARINV